MKLLVTAVAVALICFGCLHSSVEPQGEAIKVAVVTGGHAFDEGPFLSLFEGYPGIEYVHVPQKDHSELFEDISGWPYDVIALYNMTQDISEKRRENFVQLLDQGVGLVVLHHTIAAFQDWPEFEEIIGARYVLEETATGGVTRAKSGYQHDVDFTIHVEDSDHPVTRGLSDFRVHDEVYNNWYMAAGNRVLLTTDHPASDKAVCWVRKFRKANVCYIQMGHGTSIFADESYRRLVVQAIRWTAGSNVGDQE